MMPDVRNISPDRQELAHGYSEPVNESLTNGSFDCHSKAGLGPVYGLAILVLTGRDTSLPPVQRRPETNDEHTFRTTQNA